MPVGQPIDGAATSALRDQVASLAERDELIRRFPVRELKQLGPGPAVEGSASRQPAQQDEVVEGECLAAATGLMDEANEAGVRSGGK